MVSVQVDEIVFNDLSRLNQRFIQEAEEEWDNSNCSIPFPEFIKMVFNQKWEEYIRGN